MAKPNQLNFRLKKLDVIGFAEAEEDFHFLRECFVDVNSELDVLKNLNEPRRIIVGRTGAGKSAVLQRLIETEKNVIFLQPDDLAFEVITSSKTFENVSEMGVDLHKIFKDMWRLIFAIEISRLYLENKPQSTWENIKQQMRPSLNKSIERMQEWTTSTADLKEKVKLITDRVESSLEGSVRAKFAETGIELKGSKKWSKALSQSSLSSDEKRSVIESTQKIVNEARFINNDIYDVLNTVLTDPQKPYYIVLDKLDDGWRDDNLRLLLIHALIDEAKSFKNVKNAKVVAALRLDLVERVLQVAKNQKAQTEKLEQVCLHLTWTKQALKQVIDRRIAHLVASRHPGQVLGFRQLLPNEKINRATSAIDYILDRTLLRPRDAIDFFNRIIGLIDAEPRITTAMIQKAEAGYSKSRLEALVIEWSYVYPNLERTIKILHQCNKDLKIEEIDEERIKEMCEDLSTDSGREEDEILKVAKAVSMSGAATSVFMRHLFAIFYRVGLISLKTKPYEPDQWSMENLPEISPDDITEGTKAKVHPCFWRVLDVR